FAQDAGRSKNLAAFDSRKVAVIRALPRFMRRYGLRPKRLASTRLADLLSGPTREYRALLYGLFAGNSLAERSRALVSMVPRAPPAIPGDDCIFSPRRYFRRRHFAAPATLPRHGLALVSCHAPASDRSLTCRQSVTRRPLH